MSERWELVARLTERGARSDTAQILARALGADDLIIFIRDPEIDVLIPALGFPQTLPRGKEWPAFISECEKKTLCESTLPSPFDGKPTPIRARKLSDGSVVAFLGEHTRMEEALELLPVLPAVTSAFALERKASLAGQLADRAREAAEQARVLAAGLYAAQRDLEHALSEAERAKNRFAFLAEIGAMLASSLNYEAMLAGVARLATQRLADLCVIDIVEENEVQRTTSSHVDQDNPRLARARGLHLSDPRRPLFIREIMRKEQAWSLEDHVSGGRTTSFEHEEAFVEALREGGVIAALVLPLATRRRCLGAITLLAFTPGRRFDTDDESLAQDLARRVGLAISNALLYVAAQSAIRTREEFLSIASHEFRTPVAAIKLNLQAIERNLRSQGANTASTGRIQTALEQLDRLDKLTNKLLDVTRIATGRLRLDFEKVDLVDLACEVAERLSEHASRAGSELQIDGEVRVVGSWDRIRIDQVLVNLLSNALRYGAGKPIQISIAASAGRAILTVRDHGMGIPREAIGYVFQRFERAPTSKDRDGLGLGLYITRHIVEAHNGSIQVASMPGEGATFTVELPLMQED